MKKRTWSVLIFAFCVVVVAFLLTGAGLKMTIADASSESGLPGMRTLGSISDQYTPVKFDHPKHVMIAGSCAACHHQHQDSKKLNCKDCHAIAPAVFKNSVKSNFLACSACHGAPDPSNPSVPGLKVAYHKQCFSCHRGMGSIGADPKGCTEICHAKKAPKLGMKAKP
jgi:hypothetical protein